MPRFNQRCGCQGCNNGHVKLVNPKYKYHLPQSEQCGVSNILHCSRKYICTRKADHTGPHEAHYSNGQAVGIWNNAQI